MKLVKGIFTRDVSALSSGPSRDYEPLLEVPSHDIVFEKNERIKQVAIDIIDDSLYEDKETFEVVLKSNVKEQLHFPSQAEVAIINDDGKCFNGYCFLSVVSCFWKHGFLTAHNWQQ